LIRILIYEDNQKLREGLTALLSVHGDFEIAGAFSNASGIKDHIIEQQPDLILMDIDMPVTNGIEGIILAKNADAAIKILMFTVFEDDEKIFEAIRNGASGYLLKKTSPQQIIDAIHELHQGGAPMSASIARKVIQSFQSPSLHRLKEYALTPREMEILYSLVDGLSYKKIADKYSISISTVQTHISSVYQKLHVHSKSQAVAKVLGKNN